MKILSWILVVVAVVTAGAGGNMSMAQGTPLLSRQEASLSSKKELGCIVKNGKTTFRLFAPRASSVDLVMFNRHDDTSGTEHAMKRDKDGVWEFTLNEVPYGKYYGYRVDGPRRQAEMFNPGIVIADPYSKAVVTKNNYHQPAKSLILDLSYDWEGDTFAIPKDHNRLTIYEGHVRDLTMHTSSGIEARGTYKGIAEKGKTGGLSYLKDLGVNALELLPIHKFGVIELPYRDSSVGAYGYPTNTWNPYERNHWGYMTSYFFAPENYYATDGTIEREHYNGVDGRAVNELKDMVKALHKEGVAVLLDVVFNHVSQYDFNPYKFIDKLYYFRCDSAGRFIETSGCGNDFATERPMARRMIVDAVSYWMKEYHIDGFRFDLAAMIDWETCKEITRAAKKINPNVILIAEPWGGGKYEIAHFSDIGWASWNDQIRNGVKGQNPNDGLGFIFGRFQGGNSRRSIMSFVNGTLREDGGLYVKKEHSINYLESHDDNTMGDFIRLAIGAAHENQRVADVQKNAELSPSQLSLNKLGALFLCTSRGPLMIGEGQEYARSKVIAPTSVPDSGVGMIDRNSYNKDNETNYLNFNHRNMNRPLYDYYKGLFALRAKYPAFGSASKGDVKFFPPQDTFFVAYRLQNKPKSGKAKEFIVLLNGNPSHPQVMTLPKGKWTILANAETVDPTGSLGVAGASVTVPSTSGMVLVR